MRLTVRARLTWPALGTNEAASDKVVVTGTHRVRTPEQTLEIIAPRLMNYGITRLADVTGWTALARQL
jgi:hypothetical protein